MSTTTRARTLAASVVAVLALGGLAACGSDSDSSISSATTTGSGDVTVTDAWARESAMAAGNGAVYFTITNEGTADDTLLSASVPSTVAAEAQIHETVEVTDTTGGGMPGSTEGSDVGQHDGRVADDDDAGGRVGRRCPRVARSPSLPVATT